MSPPAGKAVPRKPQKTRVRRVIGRPSSSSQSVGREALVEAACELLKSHPPSEISRALVARHINVDPSLIRYYFRDRSSLLLAAAEAITVQYRHMVETAVARSDKTAQSRLVARVGALIELDAAYPFFNRLLLEEVMLSSAPSAMKMIRDLQSGAVGRYAELVQAGVSDRSLRPVDPSMLFVSVLGLCEFLMNGRAVLEVASGRSIDRVAYVKQYREFICDLIINGVGDDPMREAAAGDLARKEEP